MSLATTCLSRKIRISGSDRIVYLYPPTVRQVAQILHVLECMQDEEDIELLFELLAGLRWVRGSDHLVHIRHLLHRDRGRFARFMYQLLLQGYNPKVESESSNDNEPGEKSGIDWMKLLSDYCRAYPGRDPYLVYNETPFPFFMEFIPEVRREQARQKVYAATIAGFAFGGSEKMMKTWQEEGWPIGEKSQSEFVRQVNEEEIDRNYEQFMNSMRS